MTEPAQMNPVRDALVAALKDRAADGVELLNVNLAALQQDGIPDAAAIDYWVHKHSIPVIRPPATTTPDSSQSRTQMSSVESGREAYLRRHPSLEPGEAPTGTQAAGRDAYARRHPNSVSRSVS